MSRASRRPAQACSPPLPHCGDARPLLTAWRLAIAVTCLASLVCNVVVAAQQPKNASTERAEPASASHAGDVIVYGATPGGVCAAIAAAREGASVLLVEPTAHVGAMSTGGLSHCDSNQMVRSTLKGLFEEWHMRIVADYTSRGLAAPYDPTRKDQSRWTFEPHVALRVTLQMLSEAGVVVHTHQPLTSVRMDGPRLIALHTADGAFSGRAFVDGTYEGDLMAAAGVEWTIGREGRDAYDESLAGKQYPKATMAIDGLNDEGMPLPLVTSKEAGPEDAGDSNVMTYSFRLCLTDDPENRVPMPKPANYDPARFEVVRRALAAGENGVGFDLYPLPGGKFDGNNSIGRQFSIGLVGGGREWHAADQAEREHIWEAHKQYTLEFFHFLTTDPAVPAAIRERYANLGLCKDEFAGTDHFSPALYVRESRRMKGLYVISQRDILDSPEKEDPLAISSFPIDSHDCQRVALPDGGVVNEGTIFPVRRVPGQGYAYHVPYRAVLPKPDQCDNLLVPVALSCTHVGICSLRIEGAWMVIGQGAGIAAALAAELDLAAQSVPYTKLRERLLAQRQVLDLPEVVDPPPTVNALPAVSFPGLVLDDRAAALEGTWTQSTNFKPFIDEGYVFAGDAEGDEPGTGAATATFRCRVPESGIYQLLLAYSPHETRAERVPIEVSSGPHSAHFTFDQTEPLPTDSRFRLIGEVSLVQGEDTVITISDDGARGFVTVDAVQLLQQAP